MLTRILVKRFVRDSNNIDNPEVRSRYGRLEGWVSVVINLALFGIKVFGGIVVNSVSLIADAIHSLADMLSSGAVIYGFKAAAAPADKEHPFGHGRVENIVALIIAILLIVTGLEFLKAGVMRLYSPVQVEYNAVIIFLLLLTIGAKYWLARFSKKLGKTIQSKALEYDALHHKADMFTSFVVLLPLFSEKIGLVWLDGFVGVGIAGYIIYSGVDMAKEVFSPLIGESATYKELFVIKSIAMETEGVLGVHDIMMHKYGHIIIISLHAEVSEETPLVDVHEIIEEVEEKINAEMNATTI
ncbi:MAG: cation diffusion facilitator family transporter, partial [Nitrospinota bacterium]